MVEVLELLGRHSQHARVLHHRCALIEQQLGNLEGLIQAQGEEWEAIRARVLEQAARAASVVGVFQAAVAQLEAEDKEIAEMIDRLRRESC